MKLFRIAIIFVYISLFSILYAQDFNNWDEEKAKAERLFNSGKYEEAIIIFREIILKSNNESLKRESYFWLAKAYMSSDKLDAAQENLEYYLANFKKNGENYPEALYQKGRLLFLQKQYQSAIEQLNDFKKSYPDHFLVSNAYYWIGESLYAIGQFDDSAYYFTLVINKYPNSLKREASIYKLRLIELKKSELVLKNLLKWSQEQYISSLNQFKVKERTYTEALEKYKRYEKNILTDEEYAKFNKTLTENRELTEKIKELERQIELLKSKIPEEDILNRLKQLELKEKLLNDKAETLKILEEELRKKRTQN